MIWHLAARVAASALRGLAITLLFVGSWATPILLIARRCEDAAREWNPRLWDRNGDPRADNEERP